MKIFLGADHAGFSKKELVKKLLGEWGYEWEDKGAFEYDENDDYPMFMKAVAMGVAGDLKNNIGIIFGGSGQGEAMVANAYAEQGVRAGVYYGKDLEIPRLLREHNDANILSIGARRLDDKDMAAAIKIFLETPFSGEERHKRRIAQFSKR
ncbi:MAG: hypothetical protein A3B96_01635 [Candidatus Spechtbacteria bacterium RIFCSPHIGHO2_02_FULL_43_15b]|uniref:Ribose-5-phosphate isomerase n=1 Tax=Candidatus Spechtbacteria bacterium RIFCSPHIGHO2_01_FULL_43_30 TaxID=1802158 RepID=A0A1G2H7Y4_9BACT|nr:MAG: hypothetical protein A2827_01335 [Candidatus Spechtbacteria bacterium RIFCSPHIGHO2_01_FULL_43_30]OGZ60461.1 MAG: hypothetical protein A3B96_01635 [Candidatus Spechtbacteria bacterium RIFCSPHIGHO2_02_FULL_43_15b]